MAALMQDAGMTHALAALLATATGQAFPLAAPAIGALGAFVTGSNTNSNVLFASLQARTASLLGVNQLAILAAQNAGAATGSVFSPAKIVVGCSTAGMTGQEGAALRLTMRYGLVLVAAAGVIASVWTLR
jgi:lactate permease